MTKVVKTKKQKPGLVRRTFRLATRVGVLAATAAVARKTAGGGTNRDGRAPASGDQASPGAAAGAAGGAEHESSPAEVADGGRGRQAETPPASSPRHPRLPPGPWPWPTRPCTTPGPPTTPRPNLP
jgi:hypothetical protein